MSKPKKDWLFALVLTMPMALFYLGYYLNHVPALIPTGFIADDNISYIAYAKEYLEQDHFSFFYSNPFNDSADYPKIYFQVQTIIFALLLYLGISPGLCIVLFNYLGTLLSFRMAIGIYDHLYPDHQYRKLFITFFCWGGGLIALAGVPIALIRPMGNLDFLDSIFFLDPAWGWWGLNFGRGHFASSEGYYHFLFMAAILCILKRKWILAIIISLLLSLSHPFTGIEYLLIVTAWALIEKIVIRNKEVPWKFLIGIIFILGFHTFYYLFYLNQFPEHRSVSQQYALNWRLRFFHMIPAYCIVGTLAIASILKNKNQFFKNTSNRLFGAWFIVAFLLINHEVFIQPRQPIHFTRGYVWTSLFLLGLPVLHAIYQNNIKRLRYLPVLFAVLLLSDNFLWITNNVRNRASSQSTGYVTKEQEQILFVLKHNSTNRTLIISGDRLLPYLSTVYTDAYPWLSHPFTTPYVDKKQAAMTAYMNSGVIDAAWKKRDLIFIFRKNIEAEMDRFHMLPNDATVLASTENYAVVKTVLKD